MIKRVGFDQPIDIQSTDLEAPINQPVPEIQKGISGYQDSLDAASSNMFDFSRFANPASDRGIIVVGGKPNPETDRGIIVVGGKNWQSPEVSLGSGDAVQLQDANFEGAHSSLAGQTQTQTQSLSLESIPGDALDWSENAFSDVAQGITHPADTFWDAWYDTGQAIRDTGDAIDEGASAVGKFFENTVVGDSTSWMSDRLADGGDLLMAGAYATGDALDDAGKFIGDVYNDIPVLPDAVDKVGDAAWDAAVWFENLVFYPQATLDDAEHTAENYLNKAVDATEEAAKDTGGFFAGAINAVSGVAEDAGNVIKEVGNAIVEGANDAVDWVSDAWDDVF